LKRLTNRRIKDFIEIAVREAVLEVLQDLHHKIVFDLGQLGRIERKVFRLLTFVASVDVRCVTAIGFGAF